MSNYLRLNHDYKSHVTISLDPDAVTRIKQLAMWNGRNVSQLIQDWINTKWAEKAKGIEIGVDV
jgi:ribbon-helix-helix CopG family protein